jgi:hypothetical protein
MSNAAISNVHEMKMVLVSKKAIASYIAAAAALAVYIIIYRFNLTEVLTSKEAITSIIATAALAVSIITYIFEKKRFRLSALMQAFRLLNDIQHKEARRVVFGDATNASYEILGLENNKSLDELMRRSLNIVRSDFNEIATLILHDIIDSNLFVEEYWWIILKVWQKVEPKITERRNSVGPSDYMKNFEVLKCRAEKYAMKHYVNDLEKLKQTYTNNTLVDH